MQRRTKYERELLAHGIQVRLLCQWALIVWRGFQPVFDPVGRQEQDRKDIENAKNPIKLSPSDIHFTVTRLVELLACDEARLSQPCSQVTDQRARMSSSPH